MEHKPLTEERWRRLEGIFHQAVAESEPARTELVTRLCAGDPELRVEVEAMLIASDREQAAPGTSTEQRATDMAGRRVGNYQLERLLGAGGMGSVYLARRADGQFEQEAALKFLAANLRGEFFTERFSFERQALANLNHANVTRLLDSGVSPDGDPYLVMEYVDGQPIDEYCDRQRLTISERLRLFLQVCAAVEYAHRNLIVHRDLKPGNIFVSRDGVVKLLDFGTAKLLALAEADVTRTRFRMMTPRYASPEQLRGEAVTTLADVYSLGIVLYELLTGAWPFGDPSSAIAGLERAIREIEPLSPSRAITSDAAKARSTSDLKLARAVDGDLANITLKAIQPDPKRRYGSVEQLAGDLENYLDGKPVSARPQTLAYRAGKFVRRNRVAVTFATLAAIALAASGVYSAWQARQARFEASKATTVTRFLGNLLDSQNPLASGASKDMTLLEVIDRARQKLDQFDSQPGVQAELHHRLGSAYMNMFVFDKAEVELRKAVEAARRAGDGEKLAVAESELGVTLLYAGKDSLEAERLCQAALKYLNQHKNADPLSVDLIAGNYALLTWKLRGHSAQVESLAWRALAAAKSSPAVPGWRTAAGETNFAQYLIEEGRNAEAESLLKEALEEERRAGETGILTGLILSSLGNLRAQAGDLEEAERYQKKNVDEMIRVVGPENAHTGEARQMWAVSLARIGRRAEAMAECDKAIAMARRNQPVDSPNLAKPLAACAFVMNEGGKEIVAERFAREALRLLVHAQATDPRVAQSSAELGVALVKQRRFADAVPELVRSEQIYLKHPAYGPKHYATMRTQAALSAARAGIH